jgi:hypothetical protein
MRKIAISAILLAAAVLGAAPRLADKRVLVDQSKLLEAELALAKTNKSYFYFDLPANRVELRIQGVVLRSWDVAKYGQWGRPLPSGSFMLKKKEALRTPKRTNITPGLDQVRSGKEKSNEPEVLELKDMPGRFSLEFDDGITIRFIASPRTVSARLTNVLSSLGRWLYLPLKTIMAAARRSDFTDIQLVLGNESDAQGIYWTAQEGMNVLVLRK